jgi:hypothetical protein
MSAQKIRRRIYSDPVKGADVGELVRDAQQSLDGLGASIDALSVIGDYTESMGVLSSITTATYSVCANAGLVLGAGTWDVQALGRFLPAAATSIASWQVSVSTSRANDALGIDLERNTASGFMPANTNAAGYSQRVVTPVYRIAVIRETLVWPKLLAVFTISTCQGNAHIFARRVR